MDKKINIVFWSCFIACGVLIATLLTIYFTRFNGKLSDKIDEWSSFSNFIYGISTVALTALNVYLFYKLTSTANQINSSSQDISTGIIEAYAKAEEKRSKASTGIIFMQDYKNAHEELMDLLYIQEGETIDYTAVREAACNLEITYMILYNNNQIFPSLHAYPKHQAYLEELSAIQTQSKEGRPQGNLPRLEFFQFRPIPDIQRHNETVVTYYEEIMKCIQKDLGKVYAANEQN